MANPLAPCNWPAAAAERQKRTSAETAIFFETRGENRNVKSVKSLHVVFAGAGHFEGPEQCGGGFSFVRGWRGGLLACTASYWWIDATLSKTKLIHQFFRACMCVGGFSGNP